MTKKCPPRNPDNKSSKTINYELITHLNRIINTQDHLNYANLNIDSFITMAAQQVHNLIDAQGVVIEVIEGDSLVTKAGTGTLAKFAGKRSDKSFGISGLCISTHQVLRSDDTENDPRIDEEEQRELEAKSLLVTPFFYENNAAGIIKISSAELNAFSEVDIQTIRIIAGIIGSAITYHNVEEYSKKLRQEKIRAFEELRKTEKKMLHIAHHDYLTGLPNRNLFNDQLILTLAKAKRKKQLIALMYLDIDQFKIVNDTMGHAMGDRLLQAFASRLKQCLRASDVAARGGGDEFILLIDDIKTVEDAIVISNKILQAMRQPFHLDDKTIHITTSIGIAFLRDHEISGDELIRQADQALFISKSSGRNTFYIYDNDLTIEQSSG